MANFAWGPYIQARQRQSDSESEPETWAKIIGQALSTAGNVYGQRQKGIAWRDTIKKLSDDPNVSPVMKEIAPLVAQNPNLAPEFIARIAQKTPLEWNAVAGQMSKTGHPLIINKMTGEIKEVPSIDVIPTGGSQMAGVRERQFSMQDLPSNQSPQTAGGAAYQVKIASRQGKNLIARPGSPQRTALATGDLARAILRNSPTDETLRNGNFSDNLITRWSILKQKLTADSTVLNNPQIRKEMYQIFDEMDKSATPFIKNQLDDMESMGFKIPKDVRKRQLGETLPDIPFIDTNPGSNTSGSNSGWSIQRIP